MCVYLLTKSENIILVTVGKQTTFLFLYFFLYKGSPKSQYFFWSPLTAEWGSGVKCPVLGFKLAVEFEGLPVWCHTSVWCPYLRQRNLGQN